MTAVAETALTAGGYKDETALTAGGYKDETALAQLTRMRQWRERCKRDLGYDEGKLLEQFDLSSYL
ncbi:MAG: hypothetical protein NTV22_20425 [bacterium]|nr:hypothetical protein [bacterium]